MDSEKLYEGYNSNFLIAPVALPQLSDTQIKDLFVNEELSDGVIPYIHYSLMLSKSARFPFFVATNISGELFKKVPRKDSWRKDPRVQAEQWGLELYTAVKGAFDRGHMAKREDVQWGETGGVALKAADSTFYYTNAVPQHKELNRDIWRSLEDYILTTETIKSQIKINVMTGPVITNINPWFIEEVAGIGVQIPILFWKIVYFLNKDDKLFRVGFVMSQQSLLEKYELIEWYESGAADDAFMNYKNASTYQVSVQTIEQLSGLKFAAAFDPYTDVRPIELILQEVDIDPDLESESLDQMLGYKISNIVLQ